ncbi:MAG: sigma-70 family RNA polymerase sigma factor [Armatimonadota bacterium]
MRRSSRKLTDTEPDASNMMKEMLPGSLVSAGASAIVSDQNKLLAAAQLGDSDAFGILFEQTKDAVYSFVMRSVGSKEDAEDIVQEVYCRAWRSINRFRGDSKLLTWLYRIAVNLCIDHSRSKHRRSYTETETEIDLEQMELTPHSDQNIETGSINRYMINEALQKLAPACKMLVVLCDVQGFTCSEAAEIIGCSPVSARVRLSRTRRKLRRLLQDEVL